MSYTIFDTEMDCSMIKMRFVESHEYCWLYKGDPTFSKIYDSIDSKEKSIDLIPNMPSLQSNYQRVLLFIYSCRIFYLSVISLV